MEQSETQAGFVLLGMSVAGEIVDNETRKQLEGAKPDDGLPAGLIVNFIRRIETQDPARVRPTGPAIMAAAQNVRIAIGRARSSGDETDEFPVTREN
ncbi:hypothetical protein ACFL5O_06675 [Myxococcota bacterium]